MLEDDQMPTAEELLPSFTVLPVTQPDEGIVVGLRLCPHHGPEMLLESLHKPMFYLVELQYQLNVATDVDDEVVRMGGIYQVVPSSSGLAFEVVKMHGDPRSREEEMSKDDISSEDLFDRLAVFEDARGEA